MVLHGLPVLEVLCYLDDLLVVSDTFAKHKKTIEEVLKRLKGAGLKLKPSKCEIARSLVKYLGFEVSKEGIKIDDQRLKVIKDLPRPTNKKNVRKVLGVLGYVRRHVEHFSVICKPLYNLLKEDVPFEWTEEVEKAWQEIKEKLITPPVLAYPRMGWTYRLHTDASLNGTSYMLSQVKPEEVWKEENPELAETGKVPSVRARERPIAYGSAALKPYQKNYTVTELEMLAVVRGVMQNEYYLRPPAEFEVVTDHHALTTMMALKTCPPRIARWIAYLQEFNFRTCFVRGRDNVVPDYLSRLEKQATPPDSPKCEDPAFEFTEESARGHDQTIVVNTINVGPEVTGLEATSTSVEEGQDLGSEKVPQEGSECLLGQLFEQDEESKGQGMPIESTDSQASTKEESTPGKAQYVEEPEILQEMGLEPEVVGKAQEKDPYYGAILKFLTSRILPEKAKEAQNVMRASGMFEQVYGILYLKRKTKNPRPDIVLPPLKLVIPESLESYIFKKYHCGKRGGHVATVNMYEQIRDKFHVESLFQKCDQYRKSCMFCQRLRQTVRGPKTQRPRPIPPHAFHSLTCDFLGPLQASYTGRQYILCIADEFSKFVILKAVENPDAIQTAEILCNDIIPIFGIPRQLHTDQGPAFTANLIKKLCQVLNISQTFAPTGHHQSIGQAERVVQTVREMSGPLIRELDEDWEEILPSVMSVINSCPNSVTKLAPFLCVFGRLPYHPDEQLISDFSTEDNNPETSVYLERLQYKLQVIVALLKERITGHQEQVYGKMVDPQKDPYLQPGCEVLARVGKVKRKGDDKFQGPLTIIEYVGHNMVRLQWSDTQEEYVPVVVHVDDIKPCFGKTIHTVAPKSPPDAQDGEQKEKVHPSDGRERDKHVAMGTTERVLEKEHKRQVEKVHPSDGRERDKPVEMVTSGRALRDRSTLKAPEFYGEPLSQLSDKQYEELTGYDPWLRQNQFHRVKRVLGRRRNNQGEWLYKVQFLGYSPSESVWLPIENLNVEARQYALKAPILM